MPGQPIVMGLSDVDIVKRLRATHSSKFLLLDMIESFRN
jgi:hypothetical protein